MEAYLNKMNRRVRITRARERLFELYISSIPDLRGWVTYAIGAAVIFMMLAVGTWN